VGRRKAMHVEMEALKRRLFEDNSVRNVKFFPGTNADAAPEDMAREVNKFFAEAEAGELQDEAAA